MFIWDTEILWRQTKTNSLFKMQEHSGMTFFKEKLVTYAMVNSVKQMIHCKSFTYSSDLSVELWNVRFCWHVCIYNALFAFTEDFLTFIRKNWFRQNSKDMEKIWIHACLSFLLMMFVRCIVAFWNWRVLFSRMIWSGRACITSYTLVTMINSITACCPCL